MQAYSVADAQSGASETAVLQQRYDRRPRRRLSARARWSLIGAALLAFSGVGGVFGYMMSLVVFSVIMVWALILATYIAFRRRGERGGTFRMPGGVVTACVGLVGLAAVFATVFVRPSMQVAAMVGIPAVIVATVLYAVVGRRRIDPADIDSAFEEAESMR